MAILHSSWELAVIAVIVYSMVPAAMGLNSWADQLVPCPTGGRPGPPLPVIPVDPVAPDSQAATKGLTDKIYPTSDAAENEYPFLVALLSKDKSHHCSGSLIHKRWVLTAAHCLAGAFYVRLGAFDLTDNDTSSEQVIEVGTTFNVGGDGTDIGLIRMSSTVNVVGDPAVALIEPLRSAGFKEKVLANEKECRVAGWGRTKYPNGWFPANRPQHQNIRFVNRTEAIFRGYATVDKGEWWLHTEAIYDNACEWGSTCNGDSGGPIFCKRKGAWVQVALTATSSGFDGCIKGVKGSTDVHYFVDTIESIVGGL